MFINLSDIKKNQYKLYFLLPAIILVSLFFILPIILNLFYSFTDWTTYKSGVDFIGLKNIIELSEEGMVWKSLIITFKYAIGVCIIMNLGALILALALEKTTKISTLLRTTLFMPVLMSSLASGYLFKAIFSNKGPLNNFLGFITGGNISFPFLGSVEWTIFFVILVHSWKYFGVPMLIYIAGLNLIPVELKEAAKVEGANPLQIITKIKIPLLGPAFTFSIITSLIGAMWSFEIPLSMVRGGPARTTEVLNMYIFNLFGSGRWGYATSVSLLLFLIICAIAFPLIIVLKKREVEL